MKFINRFSSSRLSAQIFTIFWITILLMLLVVFALQTMDPRKSHALSKTEFDEITNVIALLESRYSDHFDLLSVVDEIDVRPRHKKLRLYVIDESGHMLSHLVGMKRRALEGFVAQSMDAEQPTQQLFGRFMLAGPFSATLAQQKVTIYSGKKWKKPPPLLLQLIDKPVRFLCVVMLISTPLLLTLSWALSQPARRLGLAAKRVAQGEFKPDLSLEKGSKEFQQTGKAFNQMVLSVNNMMSTQQRLLSDISHELRSPLTRLKMANALASRKYGYINELQRIEMETDRLEKMISELLQLSRMQINVHKERETLSLTELFMELLEDAQFEAEQKQKNLQYSVIPTANITGNPQLLMSALENIVRNAIHYATKKVNIDLTTTESHLIIQVEDDGLGVSEHEREAIFRPFYRVSTARDRDSGGAGLGLAIAGNAIAQHSGTIRALAASLGGLQVEITLPINT